jgi:hypothetical protein
MKLPFSVLIFTGAMVAALALSACQRAPQTAEDLRQRLPRRFAGEVHWQGSTESQRVRIEPRELSARDAHLLEFNGAYVYLLDPQGGVLSEKSAAVRGTISAPGLEVRIEELGAPAGGEDLLKRGSFSGKLSDDLQSAEAAWMSGFGNKGSLKLKAESPR